LSPGFEPIRIRVARQRKPAAAFGNEIGPQANFLIGRSRRCSRPGRHRDPGFLRKRTFLATRRAAFSTGRLLPRARRFARLHFGGRSAGFRWRLIFILDNFVLFRHRLVGGDDSNPFTAHRPLRKCFLACLQWGDKLQKLPKMKHFVFRWAITTIAVMVASSIIHGIRYDTVAALIGAALLLGILNAFVRPILLILSVPLILLTLGFFILILNALMLFFVPSIVIGFHVDSFWSAFWGAIVVSIVSWILSAFFRGSDGRVHVLTHHTQIRRVRGRVIEPGERR
jgi:putative membrane protein